MTLQSLDVPTLAGYITAAWQKDLKTDADPANGQWYVTGPKGGKVGLYGGLTDKVGGDLAFDESAMRFIPSDSVGMSDVIDNRDGKTPEGVMTLSYKYSKVATTSHTVTHSVGIGAGIEIDAGVDFIVASAGTKISFSIDYKFEYSSATSEEEGKEITYTTELPVKVPAGKIYEGVIIAQVQKVTVPFTATITVEGDSETWFEDRINGLYNHRASAGDLFGWINKYGVAGADSKLYRDLGSGKGGLVVNGTMTAKQAGNFKSNVYDITDQPDRHQTSAAKKRKAGDPHTLPAGKPLYTVDH